MPKFYLNSRELVVNFYQKIKFSRFNRLTLERCHEIDEIVNEWWYYFHGNTVGLSSLCYMLANKLTSSAKVYGLNSGDEIFYFYIKMVDPSLVLLETYECANTNEELEHLAKINFNYFDKYLLILEKMLNERFKFYTADKLWSRDIIRK